MGPHFTRSGQIVALNRVLILRVALPAADAQILTGIEEARAPNTWFIFGRKRSITWLDVSFLWLSGLRPIYRLPVFVEPPPVKAITFATAGSAVTISTNCFVTLSMA